MRPEILAPAGGIEAFWAAVEHGADAVYLGGELYNARQSAANFSLDELKEVVWEAHLRGVRVYLTTNILLADQEVEGALEFIADAYALGIDAVIVQDLGLMHSLRRLIPELAVHASTQMTIHNHPGLDLLETEGVRRAVLARELSLGKIRDLSTHHVETEVFVHGALCISYSGLCLTSSLVGARSGNRGRCAQPCRLPYQLLKDGQGVDTPHAGSYLLSPKDLRALESIADLADAGVASLKIEGRLKRPEYVASVVGAYRQAVQAWEEGVELGEVSELDATFNRGYTPGYLLGVRGTGLMSTQDPANQGQYLGEVDRVSGKGFRLKLQAPLRVGDGISVGKTGGRVGEILVGGESVEQAGPGDWVLIPFRGQVQPKDRVEKKLDQAAVARAQEAYRSPRSLLKIPLAFHVEARLGQPLKITVHDGRGNSGVGLSQSLGEKAQKRPLTQETLRDQLDRLGNTPFEIRELTMELDPEVIFPLSQINLARRDALESLSGERIGQTPTRPEIKGNLPQLEPGERPERTLLAVSVGTPGELQAALGQADLIYIGGEPLQRLPSDLFLWGSIDPIVGAIQQTQKTGAQAWVSTPTVLHDGEWQEVAQRLEAIGERAEFDGILTANLGLLYWLRQHHPQWQVSTDLGLHVFNRFSWGYLRDMGVRRMTLSAELTLAQVKGLAGLGQTEVVVQGALVTKRMEHCLIGSSLFGVNGCQTCSRPCREGGYGLRDRKGYIWEVDPCRYGRGHLLNPADLALLDEVGQLVQGGVEVIRILATGRGEEYLNTVLPLYRQALENRVPKGGLEVLRHLRPGGITRGHAFRGVME